jgi:hypothetical protein
MEQRISQRRRVLKAGTIAFGGAGIDCIVRDLSDKGALLVVEHPAGIPDRITLLIQSDKTSHAAHIVWRRHKSIGVAFD